MIDYEGINYAVSQISQEWDKNMMKPLVKAMDDGNVDYCTIRYEWVICDSCNGHGGSSAHLGVYTREELHELDDEFIDDYFSGRYNKSCNACDGTGKVKEIDYDSMPESVKKWIDDYCDHAYNDAMLRKSEWMAGA